MKKSIVKFISLTVALLLMTSIFFGCSGYKAKGGQPSNENADIEKEANSSDGMSKTELTALPIVKEPITLTYYTELGSKAAHTMKSHAEMACYKELEKRTGIKIEFIHPPMGQESEHFNLMIASRDLPDIIYWNWLDYPGGPEKAISDGIIIKLNEYMDKYAPNLKQVFSDSPDARKQSMLDDGSYYMFPFLKIDPSLKAGGPVIRKDWLDKLSLSIPKTLDDWYNMLKTFKEKDPNGNGKTDEIPLIARKEIGRLEGLTSFTAPFGVVFGFYQDDGKIKYGPIEEGYKQFIITMNKWYKEGLLDREFAATDEKSFDAKLTSERAGAYIGRIANTFGRYLTLMKDKNSSFNLTGAPWPIGPAGKPYNVRTDMVLICYGQGAAISTKNEHVIESVRWLDYHYSPDGHMLMNFGILGESYIMEGDYPKYTDIIVNNPELGATDALAKYAVSQSSGPIVQDKRYFEQILVFPQQKECIELWNSGSDTSLLLPPIAPSIDESAKFASIMSDIDTLVSEMFTKFIMGVEPIDKFEEYVQQIKKMGIDEAIKIQQAAYDRYNNRK
ncbi:MAG: extracellular solute-binding protein [Firmicutes bacterium]|nr:extracellular solute-binding protein [Bacillota bacterium]